MVARNNSTLGNLNEQPTQRPESLREHSPLQASEAVGVKAGDQLRPASRNMDFCKTHLNELKDVADRYFDKYDPPRIDEDFYANCVTSKNIHEQTKTEIKYWKAASKEAEKILDQYSNDPFQHYLDDLLATHWNAFRTHRNLMWERAIRRNPRVHRLPDGNLVFKEDNGTYAIIDGTSAQAKAPMKYCIRRDHYGRPMSLGEEFPVVGTLRDEIAKNAKAQ